VRAQRYGALDTVSVSRRSFARPPPLDDARGGCEGHADAGSERRPTNSLTMKSVLLAPPRLRAPVRMLAALAALALASAGAGALCLTPLTSAARAANGPGLIVVPTAASGPQLSFFKLTAKPGRETAAGTLDVRNPTRRRVRVLMSAVDGMTIDTLGSTYAQPGSHAHRAATWVRLGSGGGIGGSGTITLGPGEGAAVPVSVVVPAAARAGDYLAGVSVESLDQHAASVRRKGIAIASAVRYAIGVEVSIPGPRTPSIVFTGAELRREPAGLTFMLLARNTGNVILENVHGGVLVTAGRRSVRSAPLGPGTFVSSTAIAYPVLTPHEQPRQGSRYRVRAWLQYAGGIARLDTIVVFGRAAALRQQAYGGPHAPSADAGMAAWLIALLAALGVGLLAGAIALLIAWRRRRGVQPALRTLEAALTSMRASGLPLSLIAVHLAGAQTPPGSARLLRSRLRRGDRLCELHDRSFLVVAADTDVATADALAVDLRRHVARASLAGSAVEIDVFEADSASSAPELLARVQATGAGHVPATAT
jgi:hypothetical protein